MSHLRAIDVAIDVAIDMAIDVAIASPLIQVGTNNN